LVTPQPSDLPGSGLINFQKLATDITTTWNSRDWRADANQWINALAPAMGVSFGSLTPTIVNAFSAMFPSIGQSFGAYMAGEGGIASAFAGSMAVVMPGIGADWRTSMNNENPT